MKTVQINKIKYRIFEEDELREKLGMNQKDIELILEYQRLFPELLQNENTFIYSARKLYLELGLNESQWSRWSNKNIISNTFFMENESWKVLDIESTTSKGGKRAMDYSISVDMAKHLCMKADNIIAHKFRSYFILMEKTLRDYESWNDVREPQKQNANKLKSALKSYSIRNNMDADYNGLYAREFNMINEELTGFKALDIKLLKGYNDKNTREHLKIEVNKAIDSLQHMDIFLLINNKSFEERNSMIKTMCNSEYKYIKEQFS